MALLKKREAKFALLSKHFPSEIITKWEDMDITPHVVGDSVISVYEVKMGKGGMFSSSLGQSINIYIHSLGPPTQGKQYENYYVKKA